VQNVKIELRPTATISGRATDENDEPVAGATAEVLRFEEVNGSGLQMLAPILPVQFTPGVPAVQTDDQGEFRIPGLDPGEYYLRILPSRDDPGRARYPATYFPNATDPSEAAKIVATTGEISHIEVHLAATGVRVTGKFVLGATVDTPRAVLLIPQNPRVLVASPLGVTNNLHGENFEMTGVVPGSYYLYSILGTDPSTGLQWMRTPVNIGTDDVESLRIVPASGGYIKGQVTFAPHATGREIVNLSSLVLGFRFGEITPMRLAGSLSTQVRRDGQFELPHVSEGRLYVRDAHPIEGWFVSGLRFNGEDVMGSGFSVPPSTENTLEVEISNAGGAVTGIIKDRDDRPVSGGRYVLLPDPALRTNPALITTGVADGKGEFKIEAILPGEYTVIAFPDEDRFTPIFMRNVSVVEKYEPFGERVHIEEGSTQVNVHIIPDLEN
jgi:protocatechuate 3,4-dioxygenase beta subunit